MIAPALMLGVTMFFWGTAFRASRIAADHAAPVMVTMLRSAPAAVILLLACVVLRSRLPDRRLWGYTAVTGVLMVALALEGISEGAARAGAANAAILTNASPFIVMILGSIFLAERTTRLGVLGLLIGFAGIVLMVSTQLGDIQDGSDFALGMCIAFAGAAGWAVGVLMTKRMFTKHPTVDMVGFTAAQYLVGAAVLIALGFGLEGTGSTDWSSGDFWGAIAWISIGASVIATLAFFGALKRMSATTVTAWQFLAPVVAVVTEIVYGNTPDGIVLAGMAVAIVGVAIVNAAPQVSARLAARGETWISSARAK